MNRPTDELAIVGLALAACFYYMTKAKTTATNLRVNVAPSESGYPRDSPGVLASVMPFKLAPVQAVIPYAPDNHFYLQQEGVMRDSSTVQVKYMANALPPF